MGLAAGTATCLLLVSLDDTCVEAASLCLLIESAGLGTMGQNFVSREEARSATCLSLCGQWLCLRAAAASHLWSIDIGIYVQFCVLFYFTLKKTLSEAKEVRDVLHKQLASDCWFHLLMERKVVDSAVV